MENIVLNTKSAASNGSINALKAVKLDPAVLEARITDNTLKKNLPSEPEILTHQEKSNGKIKNKESAEAVRFEETVRVQKAALLSLAPQQFDMLLKYAGLMRINRLLNQNHWECAFCKNNGKPASWYSAHVLKDSRGRVQCPVLRGYRCRNCGATGDRAHTIKYCPERDN